MSREETADFLERAGLISIIRLDRPELAQPVVAEMIAGGVTAVEFSLAMPAALEALAVCAAEFEGRARFGAGTVRSEREVADATEAGASFLISPHVDPAVIVEAETEDILHIPGAMTPTEIASAASLGAPLIKLFPAGALGAGYVRDLLGPFPDLRLIPTGGVTRENVAEFVAAGAAAVAVAGDLVQGAAEVVPPDLAAKARLFIDLIANAGGST